jgi:hypothetical protein
MWSGSPFPNWTFQMSVLLTRSGIGNKAINRFCSCHLLQIPIALNFRSSDDEPLSNLMDCEPLRSVVACDSQTIAIRESQSHFSFRRAITSFDGLLKQAQHWYCIEWMALGPDNFATFARGVRDPTGARKAAITPVKLEVVHSERNLANLLSFDELQV